MKLKKIFAVLAATAIAGSMAISASADDIGSCQTNDKLLYEIDFSNYTGEDLEKVVKVEADLVCDSGYMNGFMGGNIGGTWTDIGQTEINDTDVHTWTLETPDGGLANYILDEKTGEVSSQPYFKVEIWWVNALEAEEDGTVITAGTATLKAVRLLDADGNEVAPSGNAGSTETPADTDKPADSTPSTDDKPATDNSTSTGLVGLSLAGLAVAGAAVVASKKKN